MELTANQNLLYTAAQGLLGVCDGAMSKDGVGFGKGHAMMMHTLLTVPADLWTDQDWADCYDAVRVHQGQVPDFAAIQPIVVSDGSVTRKGLKKNKTQMHVSVAEGGIRFAFNYSKKLVAAVKTIPGVRFDRASLSWTAPLTSHAAIKAVIADTRTEVSAEVWQAIREAKNKPVEAPKPEAPAITASADGIVMRTPYVAKDDCRAIAGARWNADLRAWVAPQAEVKAVLALAEKHGLLVAPEVKALTASAAHITLTPYGYIAIKSPFAAKDDIRFHTSATWDKAVSAWMVPVHEVEAVLDVAGRWNLTVSQDVFALLA